MIVKGKLYKLNRGFYGFQPDNTYEAAYKFTEREVPVSLRKDKTECFMEYGNDINNKLYYKLLEE